MNRDPTGYECTRDPIFILLTGRYQLTGDPDGLTRVDECFQVADETELEEWVLPFVEWEYEEDVDDGRSKTGYVYLSQEFYKAAMNAEHCHGDYDQKYCEIEWQPERVFLTRQEGESWAKTKEHRWDCWKVYCVCAEGELAKLLNELPEAAGVGR